MKQNLSIERNHLSFIKPTPSNILVVEDDPFWQELIGRLIRSLPTAMNLRFARSTHHAENLIYRGAFDLIIFDHYLEGECLGHDFFVHARQRGIHTPMIMLSSITENELNKQMREFKLQPLFCPKRECLQSLKKLVQLNLPSKY